MSNYLSEHKFPEELRTMDYDQLELLSYELRDFLVESVSKTGGHLASNLGIVELTIALHRCFDTPRDKIIWDVGHQSYVHKILTGRMNDFENLRKYGVRCLRHGAQQHIHIPGPRTCSRQRSEWRRLQGGLCNRGRSHDRRSRIRGAQQRRKHEH